MCGRFTLTKDREEIEERFEIHIDPTMFSKTYNAAPSQTLPIITNDEPEQASFHRWGLIPLWAKDERIGNKLINARAETLTEKPSYRAAVKKKALFSTWQIRKHPDSIPEVPSTRTTFN